MRFLCNAASEQEEESKVLQNEKLKANAVLAPSLKSLAKNHQLLAGKSITSDGDTENPIFKERRGSKESQESKACEIYHLKAIETVCKFISSPCPYINHLIVSYQKHYNQALETIVTPLHSDDCVMRCSARRISEYCKFKATQSAVAQS
jgi:hypothetical protein